MAATADRSAVHAVGLDVGTARTKIAVGRPGVAGPPSVQVLPTVLATTRHGGRSGDGAYAVADEPDAALHDGSMIRTPDDTRLFGRFLAGLLSGPDAALPADPRATSLVVAVPDDWVSGTHSEWLRHLLTEELGFATVRVVSETLCAAARVADTAGLPPRIRLLCDVGADSVTAAACAFDGRTVRLLDVESTRLPPHASVDAVLLDRLAATPQARVRLARALHDERRRHSHRAQLVLEQIQRHPEYGQTPVYFLPDGVTVNGEALSDALAGVEQSAADVVDRLRSRSAVSSVADVVITGGSVFPTVVERVRRAARTGEMVTLDPTGAACGAQRIAAGSVTALDSYPHVLGLAVRRIRYGLLESDTVEVAGTATALPSVHVTVDPEEELAVRWKPNGRGDWEVVRPVALVHVPADTYRVEVRAHRSGAATLLLHGRRTDRPVTVELPTTPGAVR